MSGNICRCGAYANIVAAVLDANGEAAAKAASDARILVSTAPQRSRTRSRRAERPARKFLGRRHQSARSHEGRYRTARRAHRHHRLPLSPRSKRCLTGGCASAHWRATATPRTTGSSASAIRCCRRRCSRARRRSCATWRPSAAISCSARAATILRRRVRALQQARPRHGLRGARRLQSHARDLRCQRTVRRGAPIGHGVALAALDAVVRRARSRWRAAHSRSADFHRLPGDHAGTRHERSRAGGTDHRGRTARRQGFAAHAHYLKVRDRASYAFALVSVAAALELDARRHREDRAHRAGRRRAQAVAGTRGREGR